MGAAAVGVMPGVWVVARRARLVLLLSVTVGTVHSFPTRRSSDLVVPGSVASVAVLAAMAAAVVLVVRAAKVRRAPRSEEHSLNSSHANISYAVCCLKKKTVLTAPMAPAALVVTPAVVVAARRAGS